MTRRDAVERYLDDLFDYLAGTGAAGRRALIETEDHLTASKADLVASGCDDDEAAVRAVARFGDAREIARELRIAHRDFAGLARHMFMTAWLLGGVGSIAVGISGLLAEAMRAIWGASFVSGDINGITHTASRCAQFIGFFPGRSCADAAALHHAGEVVDYRVALGVLGLLILGAFTLARRTLLRGPRWGVAVGPAILLSLALFGLAAMGLGGLSLLQLAFQGFRGIGENISAGIVAGFFSLAAGAVGLRQRAPEN